ncbi:hypothetical protein DL93DRAFT_859604 [Clavulina sp. PMI_390]|nr:hypothetical protein DL93DRAFT_859604 [Clavulina sp. PMI_390]
MYCYISSSSIAIICSHQYARACSEDVIMLLDDGKQTLNNHFESIEADFRHIYRSTIPFLPSKSKLAEYYDHLISEVRVLWGRPKGWLNDRLWIVSTRAVGRTPVRLAYSLDGSHIATGHERGEVNLWRASDGKHLRSFSSHTDYISGLAFLSDHSRFVSYSSGRLSLHSVNDPGCDLFFLTNRADCSFAIGHNIIAVAGSDSSTGATPGDEVSEGSHPSEVVVVLDAISLETLTTLDVNKAHTSGTSSWLSSHQVRMSRVETIFVIKDTECVLEARKLHNSSGIFVWNWAQEALLQIVQAPPASPISSISLTMFDTVDNLLASIVVWVDSPYPPQWAIIPTFQAENCQLPLDLLHTPITQTESFDNFASKFGVPHPGIETLRVDRWGHKYFWDSVASQMIEVAPFDPNLGSLPCLIAYSPGDELVALAPWMGEGFLELRSQKGASRHIPMDHQTGQGIITERPTGYDISASGKLLAAATRQEVRVIDIDTGLILWTPVPINHPDLECTGINPQGPLQWAQFVLDDSRVICEDYYGVIRMVNELGLVWIHREYPYMDQPLIIPVEMSRPMLSPDGKYLARISWGIQEQTGRVLCNPIILVELAVSHSSSLRILDAAELHLEGKPTRASFSPDSSHFGVIWRPYYINVWSTSSFFDVREASNILVKPYISHSIFTKDPHSETGLVVNHLYGSTDSSVDLSQGLTYENTPNISTRRLAEVLCWKPQPPMETATLNDHRDSASPSLVEEFPSFPFIHISHPLWPSPHQDWGHRYTDIGQSLIHSFKSKVILKGKSLFYTPPSQHPWLPPELKIQLQSGGNRVFFLPHPPSDAMIVEVLPNIAIF